jgi:hypothetical protein
MKADDDNNTKIIEDALDAHVKVVSILIGNGADKTLQVHSHI